LYLLASRFACSPSFNHKENEDKQNSSAQEVEKTSHFTQMKLVKVVLIIENSYITSSLQYTAHIPDA